MFPRNRNRRTRHIPRGRIAVTFASLLPNPHCYCTQANTQWTS